ncbi:hypothetical protein ACLOJK_022871 [Asimina triloba]
MSLSRRHSPLHLPSSTFQESLHLRGDAPPTPPEQGPSEPLARQRKGQSNEPPHRKGPNLTKDFLRFASPGPPLPPCLPLLASGHISQDRLAEKRGKTLIRSSLRKYDGMLIPKIPQRRSECPTRGSTTPPIHHEEVNPRPQKEEGPHTIEGRPPSPDAT